LPFRLDPTHRVMKARLVSVGERMPSWVSEGFAEYRKRLSRELPLELLEIPLGARGKGRDDARAIADEGAAVLAALPRDSHVIALDGRGTPWTSEQLAAQLAGWRMAGRDLAILIGGPDGHAPAVLQRANERWSLGPLTLPHMLVRLVVAEQLYRAAMIVAGHPYHRA
jgi:23S rRNA (pseudouridine1915-N3)-methyltransferase